MTSTHEIKSGKEIKDVEEVEADTANDAKSAIVRDSPRHNGVVGLFPCCLQ